MFHFKIRGLFCLFLAASTLLAQEAEDFFRQNCMSCHTIGGGRLTGPDLKDVSTRKDAAWLTQFLLNPQAVIDAGDAYALKLKQDSRGVVMPAVTGMTKARAESILKLIAAESKLEKSQFAGLRLSERPFTAADIEQGQNIFLGTRAAANGAPSCISCHTVKGVGGLGGGRLGPDLTRVYERLEGRKNLAAWLFAPATPTMQPIFKRQALQPEEILPLVAYLESTARGGGESDAVSLLNFVLIGLGGTAFALVLFDSTWKQRFRAVRGPLVASGRAGKKGAA